MEPLDHPIWRKRAKCLASLLPEPMTLAGIKDAARTAWRWEPWLTANVIAAAEGREFRARKVDGKWRYGRVPGNYPEPTPDHALSLRTFVASTVPATNRRIARAK